MTSFWGHQDNPYPPKEKFPVCPICHKECTYIYRQKSEILGCDNCIDQVNAWEEPACMEENR